MPIILNKIKNEDMYLNKFKFIYAIPRQIVQIPLMELRERLRKAIEFKSTISRGCKIILYSIYRQRVQRERSFLTLSRTIIYDYLVTFSARYHLLQRFV